MNLRKVMYVVIVIVCIWSIAIGVYDEFNNKFNNKNTVQNLAMSVENTVDNEKVEIEEETETQDELKKEFDKMFTNELNIGDYDTSGIEKIEEEEEILYTSSAQRKNDNYEININFPIININSDVAKKIDSDSKEIFIEKANNIIKNETEQTVYTVSYCANINDDILSIIIKSTLKEGTNPQRVMVQTYNIDLVNQKEVTISDLLKLEDIDEEQIKTKINSVITTAIKDANVIKETGYDVYDRDINNSIYKIENIDTFFIDENGKLCIIFAYGNYEFTTELDIVKI